MRCLQQSAANRTGVCVFIFVFYPLSKDNSWYYYKNKRLEPTKWSWDCSVDYLYKISSINSNGSNLTGSGVFCNALIQYNNWQFLKYYLVKLDIKKAP